MRARSYIEHMKRLTLLVMVLDIHNPRSTVDTDHLKTHELIGTRLDVPNHQLTFGTFLVTFTLSITAGQHKTCMSLEAGW